MKEQLLGLRTVIYKVSDLSTARAWYSKVFGISPYFDEPFYVGFNIGGFELGLDPDTSDQRPGGGGATAYWGVGSMETTISMLRAGGVAITSEPREVGDGIKVATVADPFGNIIGLIENPHFVSGR